MKGSSGAVWPWTLEAGSGWTLGHLDIPGSPTDTRGLDASSQLPRDQTGPFLLIGQGVLQTRVQRAHTDLPTHAALAIGCSTVCSL